MIRLGKFNELEVLREVDFGMYLDAGDIGDVLLPRKYIPEGTQIGDKVSVFLYLDSEERLIATTETPLVEVNQFAFLEVSWVNEFGAFLEFEQVIHVARRKSSDECAAVFLKPYEPL